MIERSFYKQPTMPDLISKEGESPLPAFIGPYKIETLLNQGGMSFLYLGIHPETKIPLVVKVLSPSYVNHPEAVDHFLKEAKVIAMTNHPNIVKLYGHGEWEKGLYISMEFIRGISLRQFIMQHSLSRRRALEIILQVAYAILHLHSHNVIHRDIKPENILIGEEGEIKVIDFGIAQLHEEETPTDNSRVLGTPNYMSPEQKEDPSTVTFASDIYSLGIILYELIVGKLSYGVINLSSLPKGLKKIASKALAVSVKERYQKISDFIHDISQYLTTGELEKERPESDQIKELQETVQKANVALSPLTPPNWPQIDVGIAKPRNTSQIGLYSDFFRLANNTFLILMVSSLNPSLESAVHIAVVRGMIQMQLHSFIPTTKTPFDPTLFVESLNQLLSNDPLKQEFAFNLVHLDPFHDQLTYIACGAPPLLHIPQGQTLPRELPSFNPLLGSGPHTISETSDNWNPGDILIMHSMLLSEKTPPENEQAFNALLSEIVKENALLSSQRQAETILKKISNTPYFPTMRTPKALIALQRII